MHLKGRLEVEEQLARKYKREAESNGKKVKNALSSMKILSANLHHDITVVLQQDMYPSTGTTYDPYTGNPISPSPSEPPSLESRLLRSASNDVDIVKGILED